MNPICDVFVTSIVVDVMESVLCSSRFCIGLALVLGLVDMLQVMFSEGKCGDFSDADGMGTAEWRSAKSPCYYKRGDYIPGMQVRLPPTLLALAMFSNLQHLGIDTLMP